jgi:hypothetical protein
MPLVNVKLEIISERMAHQPLYFSPRRTGAYGEQLVVKWKTSNGGMSISSLLRLTELGQRNVMEQANGTAQDNGEKKTFTGLFLFEFDKDGKIISHTIEHVDEHGEWEKGVGAKVVGLTDWLLGGMKGRNNGGGAISCFENTPKKDNRQ